MISLLVSLALCDKYETKTYKQILDHDSPSATFDQRYYVNTDYAQKADSIIFYIGGLAVLDVAELTDSPVNKIAKETKSVVIGLENRYFGNSIPTEDLSTENLKYNTVAQHMEDIRNFIRDMKKEYCNDKASCRVATVGRGFGASLATWIHLQRGNELNIVGTWSSSAFLLADDEFSGYDHHEAVVINQWGDCQFTLGDAYGTIDGIAGRKDDATVAMESKLGVDAKYGLKDRPLDFSVMFSETISRGLRYTQVTPHMESLCNLLNYDNYSTNEQVVNLFAEYVPKLLPNGNMIDLWPRSAMDPSKSSKYAAQRAEYYIKCNEMTSFPCAGKNPEFRNFYINPAYWTGVCTDLFGITKLPNPADFNKKYGGRFPPAKRTFFTHGFNDAYLEASCTLEDLSIEKRSENIIGGGFSDDLNPESPSDSQNIKRIRNLVVKTMIDWIKSDAPVPPPPSTSPEPQKEGLTTTAKIIIGCLSGAIVIAIIVAVILFIRIKKAHQATGIEQPLYSAH